MWRIALMRGFIDLNTTVAIKNQPKSSELKQKTWLLLEFNHISNFTCDQYFDFISSYQLRYIVEPTVDLSLSIFNGFP